MQKHKAERDSGSRTGAGGKSNVGINERALGR